MGACDHRRGGGDFFDDPTTHPLVLLGATSVEDGCRMNVATLRLTQLATPPNPGICSNGSRPEGTSPYPNPERTPPFTIRASAAAGTSDVLDFLCQHSSSSCSTAALLSARFPYVTPSGRLRSCGKDKRYTSVVDGGYADNTAIDLMLDLCILPGTARATPQRRRNTAPWRRALIFSVELDNHYAKGTRATSPSAST